MDSFLSDSTYFGFLLTAIVFFICTWVKNKTKINLLNPLLTSTAVIVTLLLIFNIKYSTYNNGAKYISYLLTPTTVCLAIPLYKQTQKLKENAVAIFSGVLSGCIANSIVVVVLCKIFNLSNEISASLLPKTVTTPIAMGIAQELGGITSITVPVVVLTGIIGAVIAPTVFKICKIKNPISQGLACGTSAHGCATSTALELGEVQGAMSGLAITIAGLITVVLAPIMYGIFF